MVSGVWGKPRRLFRRSIPRPHVRDGAGQREEQISEMILFSFSFQEIASNKRTQKEQLF
jgi:hypothetical protein